MSGVYASAVQSALSGSLDLTTGTVTAYLVTSAYTPDLGAHSTLSDVPSGARQADTDISGVSVEADGSTVRFTANPSVFTAATGDPVTQVVVALGSALVAVVDDFGAGSGNTSLDLNGSDVTITWSVDGVFYAAQG